MSATLRSTTSTSSSELRILVDHFTSSGHLAVVEAPPGSGKTFTLIEVLSESCGGRQACRCRGSDQQPGDDIC